MGRITVEVDEGVAMVTVDDPATRNALDLSMIAGLQDAWQSLEDDAGVRACVLAGAADALCSGLHRELLPDLATYRAQGLRFEYSARQCGMTKPVVVAWDGVVAGAGIQFLVDADLVFASRGAYLFDPHLGFDMPVGTAGEALARTIPHKEVIHLLLSGGDARLTADRAYSLGLVAAVIDPPDAMRDAALAFARRCAALSRPAVAQTLDRLRP